MIQVPPASECLTLRFMPHPRMSSRRNSSVLPLRCIFLLLSCCIALYFASVYLSLLNNFFNQVQATERSEADHAAVLERVTAI